MGSKRVEKLLGEVYDFRSGLSKPASEFGSGYPFLTFKDVFYNTFVPDELGDLVNSTEAEREACNVRRGDVFLTRTSETMEDLGMSCVALRDVPFATFNGFTKRLRPKADVEIVPEFVGYFFRGPQFRRDVTAMSSMSTRASLNNDMLSRLRITLPDMVTQTANGNTLKALDDKIEQNRRTALVLERLARTIFQAWFVDFEPVKAKAAGATSFPSMPQQIFDALTTHLVDSDVGPVPAGWELKAIASIATFLNGLALQKYPPRGDDHDLRVIKIAQLRKGSTKGADLANSDVPEQYVINDGDLLFSWSGTLEAEFWFGGKGALNQHLFKVTSAHFPSWFCLLWIRQHLTWFRAIAASKATTMGHIQRGHLQEAKVIVPPEVILRAANAAVGSLYELHAQIMIESQKLAELRDLLLPKLISGEVRVQVNEDASNEC
jgi:type I restriction enzyme S subunit